MSNGYTILMIVRRTRKCIRPMPIILVEFLATNHSFLLKALFGAPFYIGWLDSDLM
jgi:hypothetical protein